MTICSRIKPKILTEELQNRLKGAVYEINDNKSDIHFLIMKNWFKLETDEALNII